MTQTDKPIVFVTPGASRVGGNIFFLDFLKWFKEHSSIPFLTIYGHGGAIEQEIQALGNAYRFDAESKPGSVFSRGLGRLAYELNWRKHYFQRAWLKRSLAGREIGLIYSNAISNYRMLAALPTTDAPIISHCHELESVIYRTGIDGFRATCDMTTHFVAGSRAVKDNLVETHNIDPAKIDVVHEFIPIRDFSASEIAEKRKAIFEELNLPASAFVIGASGTPYWRKAPDIFIQVANLVRNRFPDIPAYFLWIGGGKKGDFEFFELNYDVKKLDLTGRVHFLEQVPNPFDHFAALDLFLMTSREDPYPLVCLETAAMAKPQICFANAGGVPEFIEGDCGFVVPYLDTEAMAEKIEYLYNDRGLLARMGKAAAAKVRERNDISTSAPKILKIIEDFRKK